MSRPARAPQPAALPLSLIALASVLCAPACAPAEPPLGEARGAIIGGTPDQGDPAVVLLASYPPDHTTLDTCTASVIAPGVLLTAAHCLDPDTHPDYLFGVFTGADASAYPTANTLIPKLLPVKEVAIHPDYDPSPPFTADIGVVILESPLSITPLPVQRAPLDAKIEGQPARIVGYGQIKYKDPNAIRHEASTVVASLGADDTVVVGDLDHRSCIGDSGGPALIEIDGQERIAGVDSYAELSGCLEPAHYRRPDVYTAFLDLYAPPPAEGGAGGSGGGAGATGGSGGSGGGAGGAPGGAGGTDPDPGTEGGCALAPRAPSPPGFFLLAIPLALAWFRRRRRAR